MNSVAHSAERVADRVSDKAHTAASAISDKADKLADKVDELSDDARETRSNAVRNFTSSVRKALDHLDKYGDGDSRLALSNALFNLKSSVKEGAKSLNEAGHTYADKATHQVRKAKNGAVDGAHAAKQAVKDNPKTAIGIAAAAAGLALLIHSMQSRNK